jgi:hypothetical protein
MSELAGNDEVLANLRIYYEARFADRLREIGVNSEIDLLTYVKESAVSDEDMGAEGGGENPANLADFPQIGGPGS